MNPFVRREAVVGTFLFLCAVPRLSLAQSSPAAAAAPHRLQSRPAQPRPSSPDFLAGLTLTDDQKAKISKIHEDAKSRLAAVALDKKLSPEAAGAMLEGYRRIENNEVFAVLTLEQQAQVRQRVSAWRTAARQRQQQLQQTPVSKTALQPK